ncbi:MAG TPA: hypothetical protein VHA06_05360 [Candidatus Angelobacter sp.]|nr:hypothetical protein [Candidatus Angelobacter sp.]
MEDILERGFQLAYFIFPSRPQAVLILSGAMNKLKTQHGRESRRTYWRDKYLKRGITRITREESDMLQWLIFYESDHFEKEQEAAHRATLKDMAVRYIKSLVRMTSAMSSFHVNIGLNRLLHNYSTAETQRVYESITDRYPGADEYRRAKSVLMNKLEERFDGMLKTSRTQHGEMRFVSADDQEQWADMIDLCLKEFTPWSTLNACPVVNNAGGAELKLPSSLSGNGADQNLIETSRCHAFIDPLCFGRLVRALAIEPPSQRLDLPRFFMDNPDNSNNSAPQTPKLSTEERKAIADFAATEAERRQKITPTNLAIVVDGQECARLDAKGATSRQLAIREGAELIEIWTEEAGAPLLLATHKIAYTETSGIAPANFSFQFKNAAALLLQISTQTSSTGRPEDSPRSASLSVTYRPGQASTQASPRWLSFAPRFTLASAALIALGWFVSTHAHRQTTATAPASPGYAEAEKTSLLPVPAPTPAPAQIAQANELPVTYRLMPDELATRGNGAAETPSVTVPAHPGEIRLELPIAAADAARSFHGTLKTFLQDKEILAVNQLKAQKDASGVTIVTFSVPSTALKANMDYTVDLERHNASVMVEKFATYTFHTVKSTK